MRMRFREPLHSKRFILFSYSGFQKSRHNMNDEQYENLSFQRCRMYAQIINKKFYVSFHFLAQRDKKVFEKSRRAWLPWETLWIILFCK
jgi:hypothetical protein